MIYKHNLIKVLVGAMATLVMGSALATEITGAGASLPYPVYVKWSEGYKAATGNRLDYQAIGSTGGIRQLKAKTVTFGATDVSMSGADLDKEGWLQFPAVIGGTVPVFNLDGFKPGELRITGPVLAEMFMGYILNFNDPKIAALNPGKKLPNQLITVMYRADGSGTTNNFTDYLTSVSKLWADKVGKGSTVKWLASSSEGGKGNEGVVDNVSRVVGSIGYVEYAYVKKNNMKFMQLQNADGKYVSPKVTSFAAAADGADWFSMPGMNVSMVNAKGAVSWPIVTATYILMYKQPVDKAAAAEALKFFDWSFINGDKIATDLGYVPLPDTLTNTIRAKVWNSIK
jgi:phosphate transport system substrate-binding protein